VFLAAPAGDARRAARIARDDAAEREAAHRGTPARTAASDAERAARGGTARGGGKDGEGVWHARIGREQRERDDRKREIAPPTVA
jgi:hypothetical protein